MPSYPLSVLFCGTSAFAVPSLQALVQDARFRVDLVVTQPDRPVGRKQELTPPVVKVAAEKLGLTIMQPEKLNDDIARITTEISRPDFLVVVSYGQILSDAVLEFPRIAPLNVHASLLPRWRGASPIQHAMLASDTETGVTVQRMVKQLDAGPILAQAKTSINPRETATTLHDRLARMGADLLITTLTNPLQEIEQNETEIVFCHRLTRQDGIADPHTHTAAEIDRKVRALTPWPGVTITIDGKPLKLLETDLADRPDSFPLSCRAHSFLHLVRVQAPGGKPMAGAAWASGRRK